MKRVHEIKQHPRNDDVVIETYVDNDHDRGYPDSSEVGQDLEPDEDWALAQTLAQQQLQIEQRDTEQEKHYNVRDDEGTWRKREGRRERGREGEREQEGEGGEGREGVREEAREQEGEGGEGREGVREEAREWGRRKGGDAGE